MSGRGVLYNRQLHWNEKEAIHNAAHGDKAEEDRLTKAACYRVQCRAEYSENDPRWLANYVSPDDAKDLGPELKWVDSHKVLGGAFDYTWTQKLQDAGSAQLDAFTRGLSQAGEDLKNLPHDLLHSRLRSPNAAQGDANPLIDVTNGGSGTPPTATAVVTPTVVPCGPTLCPTVTVTPVVVPGTPILSSGNDSSSSSTANEASGSSGGGAQSSLGYAGLKLDLKTTEAANEVVESLRATGQLPSNYVTKGDAAQQGWQPGKALNNSVPSGQIGGDVFYNTTNVVPSASGRTWYEADIGLTGTMSRSNQPGTRLLYSSDGLLYITTDHYKTATSIGKWK